MQRVITFVKEHVVLIIAFALAVISAFIIPPDSEYLSYIDFKTIANLFVMMLVIAGLKNMRFFVYLATQFITKLKSSKKIVFALVFITFISSIFLANDMALLTFLPLTLAIFRLSGKSEYCAFTIIMQNVAANLGGMIMPFGNPQSLYLYSYFSIPTIEFISIMAVPFILSTLLITLLLAVVVKDEPLAIEHDEPSKIKPINLVFYSIFFVLALLAVLRVLDYRVVAVLVLVLMVVLDAKALLYVDYSLLLTFVCFFVFASNMARIDAVCNFVQAFTSKNVLLTGVGCCQCFSNVPTAIFLSRFTSDYRSLLLAVNIGGAGTPIASLASLISLGHFGKSYPQEKGKYLVTFLVINFTFLTVLTAVCAFLV